MDKIRILHLGDIHMDYEPKYRDKIVPSLNQISEYCTNNIVNAIVIPGDIWHRKQNYLQKSGVPIFQNWLKQISKKVDFVFITKGNHDDPGSISLLHKLESNIYSYEYPVVLAVHNGIEVEPVVDILRDYEGDIYPDYIVSLVPYPTKASFIQDNSIDNNNADFIKVFEQIFEQIGDVTQPYTCPKVLAFHGNVVGSRLSTGQTLVSQDIMVAPRTLEAAKHDYYALNHIHLRQEIKPNMVYAGGIANFNWGETEQKSFEVIEFNDVLDHPFESKYEYQMSTQQIKLTASRPMVKIDAEFSEVGLLVPNEETIEAPNGCEYRIRIKIAENDKKLFTDERIKSIRENYGEDVKIEFNIIPDQRESRSEEIMSCKSLLDEVIEFAKVTGHELTEDEKQKVKQIESGFLEIEEKEVRKSA